MDQKGGFESVLSSGGGAGGHWKTGGDWVDVEVGMVGLMRRWGWLG